MLFLFYTYAEKVDEKLEMKIGSINERNTLIHLKLK